MYVMCSTEMDTFGQEIKIALVIDNESRDLQLYNDSFLILIGRAEAELCNFEVCVYENSKRSLVWVINFLPRYLIFPSNRH